MNKINPTMSISTTANLTGMYEKWFIIGANDFNAQELATLSLISGNYLPDARWAMDGSAFLVVFYQGYNPYPMLNGYTEHTRTEILNVVSVQPWSLPF